MQNNTIINEKFEIFLYKYKKLDEIIENRYNAKKYNAWFVENNENESNVFEKNYCIIFGNFDKFAIILQLNNQTFLHIITGINPFSKFAKFSI